MSRLNNRLAAFPPFTFDFSQHLLKREQETIDLPPRTGAILEYLIENRGLWISHEELVKTFWPGVSVSVDSVHKQISEIRRALGDSPKSSRFVETKYKRGCRFIADVTEPEDPNPAIEDSVEPSSDPPRMPHLTQDVEQSPATAPSVESRDSTLATNRYIPAAASLTLAIMAATTLTIWRGPERHARVVESTQLTWDGKPKGGPLLTDGHRIYFLLSPEF